MPINFPKRLVLAQTPTPLQPLDRLSANLGGPRIWVKRDDLTGSVLSGNKVRKLEFVVAKAIEEGCDTLITCGGLQSNHCRATAVVGAQLGLKVHLILRGELQTSSDEVDGNLLLDQLLGAHLSTYSAAEYSASLPQLFRQWQAHYQALGAKPFLIPTGASDGIGAWGYIKACQELALDFKAHGIKPKYIVCATGSGGTQAGLTVGGHLWGLGCKVIGMAVCDSESYFLNKIRSDLDDWQHRYGTDINVELERELKPELDLDKLVAYVNDHYIGPGYGKATADVFSTIKSIARLEGLVLDPVYTGKAFHGLVEEIKKGNFSDSDDIVFVHTGGVFGLFPQKKQLLLEK